MKKICVLALMLSVVLSSITLYGQEKKSRKQRKAEETEMMVKQLIDEQNFIFVGTDPMETGSTRNNKAYLFVTKEKIKTENVFIHSTGYGIAQYQYTSSLIGKENNYEYKVENSEKGGWVFYIKHKSEQDKMVLKIYPNGNAVLTCTHPASSFIKTLIGYIEGTKRKGQF